MGNPLPAAERSYGCTFGCGNPYDYVFIDVRSGETEFLCLPCFVRLASDIVSVVNDPDEATQAAWDAALAGQNVTAAPGGNAKGGRRNAPATNTDPDLFDAYEDVITADELPDEFK